MVGAPGFEPGTNGLKVESLAICASISDANSELAMLHIRRGRFRPFLFQARTSDDSYRLEYHPIHMVWLSELGARTTAVHAPAQGEVGVQRFGG